MSAGFEAENVGLDPDSASQVLCDLDLGKSVPFLGCDFLIYTLRDLDWIMGLWGPGILRNDMQNRSGVEGVIRLIRVTGPSLRVQSIISVSTLAPPPGRA